MTTVRPAARLTARHKYFLRRLLREKAGAIPPPERQRAAERVARRVARLPAFRRARTVSVYLPLGSELGTAPLIALCRRSGKRVAVPVLTSGGRMVFAELPEGPSSFRKGLYGIPEPRRLQRVLLPEIGLMVVPGAGFTRRGDRLGAGGGHFDRVLAHRRRPPAVGVAFDDQVVPWLPLSPHDRRVDWVASPSRLWTAAS